MKEEIPNFFPRGMMRHFSKGSCLVIFLCTMMAACVPRVDQRGRFLEKEQTSRILPKIHTTQDVQRLLGSPTTTSTFGKPVWTYTGVETETSAFLAPDVREFEQIQITFDDNGFVQKVEQLSEETPPKDFSITPAADKTPVRGYSEGFFQQMFGNFGRISRGGSEE